MDIQIKLIPASARTLDEASPAGESRPATRNMPMVQAVVANKSKKRRPTLSTIEVPVSAPVKDVIELTKLSTRWRSLLVMPALSRRMGKK
jgi:hypothetical protein